MEPNGNGNASAGIGSGTGTSKPSKAEAIKIASQYLKEILAEEVQSVARVMSDDAAAVLKFHGSYQQDDRDFRGVLKKQGKERAYQFMVRVRIVGGKLTARQGSPGRLFGRRGGSR